MKSKYFLTILIQLLLVGSILSKGVPKPINRLIKKLQKEGVDTILVYLSGCNGCEIKHRPADCNCFINQGISEVFLIVKMKGETYREDFTCCKESLLTKMGKSLSIPFFLSLKDTIKNEIAYYRKAAKVGNFYRQYPLISLTKMWN